MERFKEFYRKPWAKTALVALGGMLFGLIVLGWWLLPVQWTDATPEYLRADLRTDYLRMAIDSYTLNKDAGLASTRWQALGKDAPKLLAEVEASPGAITSGDLSAFASLVGASPVPVAPGAEAAAPGQTGAPEAGMPVEKGRGGGLSGAMPVIFGLFCVLTLILGFLVFYIFLRRGRSGRAPSGPTPVISEQDSGKEYFAPRKGPSVRKPGASPISQFMTTYMLGEDHYDDSFTIDNPMGEFLGECGAGISDTVGVGEPKKASAFEVWLFDKNDIQTVTKVLMSRHSFEDPSAQQNLQAKGEPLLAEPGKTILLETATLQLEARIVDMNYGTGTVPPGSFFDRLTLELSVWPKNLG